MVVKKNIFDTPITAPVLFLCFNRPNLTRKVFEKIRKAKPERLFIACDGPRNNFPDDKEKVEEVRAIVSDINWNCEVKTLFHENNLGCKFGPHSAFSWFFENVDEGITLEDDCLPSLSFFYFCQELLKHYRHNTQIMHISGNNFQFGRKRGDASYYFSKYNHSAAWATWKRAWNLYDIKMTDFNDFKKRNLIKNVFRTKQEQRYWMKMFQIAYENKIDAWDYQWLYTKIKHGALEIHPNVNLIQNIGYGPQATHTFNADIRFKTNYAEEMQFPLTHPKFIQTDIYAEKFIFKNRYKKNIFKKIWLLLIEILSLKQKDSVS